MITQELLFSEQGKKIITPEDLDTTNFILSLFELDDMDISEASSFLEDYISVRTPMEELALKHIAYNFQYYKQVDDIVLSDLSYDNVYGSLEEHTVLGFYALLKEYISPYTDDWELKQSSTYSPLNNYCNEKECWVSNRAGLSLEYAAAARMLANIICKELSRCITSLNKHLYKKLDKKRLALFFDIEEFEEKSGYDYRALKDMLL